jgi:hypothetical protein
MRDSLVDEILVIDDTLWNGVRGYDEQEVTTSRKFQIQSP